MFTDDLFGEFRDRGKSTKINRPKFSLVLVYTHIRELSLKKRELLDKINSANFILKGKPRTLIAANISRFTVYATKLQALTIVCSRFNRTLRTS